jgi:hypothetical protein
VDKGGVGTIYYGDNNVSNNLGSRLHAFVQGINGHLYDNLWTGTGWAWGDQGSAGSGVRVAGPNVGTIYYGDNTVSNNQGSRLHTFVGGRDGNLYDNLWNGAGWVWSDQGTIP